MVDKKRKASETPKTAAKKRKVETPKSSAKKTPAKKSTPTPKKVTSSKVKKPEPKKTPAKPTKTPSKSPKTPAKTPAKSAKKSVEKSLVKKASPKPTPKKVEKKPKLAAASVTRAKVEKAKAVKAKVQNVKPATMKAKLDKAKELKAKAAAAKAKLKATKGTSKLKQSRQVPVKSKLESKPKAPEKKATPAKKPEPKPSKTKEEKPADEKKKTPAKATTEKKPEKKSVSTPATTKRKSTESKESVEVTRKKRTITPSRKYEDFEVDVPAVMSKRTITPNKKYADYETDTSPKRVSELRAFIQDKKKTIPETDTADKPGKPKSTPDSAEKKAGKDKPDTPAREIKVFKASEMKPAEKLLKKLQKKLEKEAKSATVPKPTENREKAKIKITKVVTYNKPPSSEDKEMRTIKPTPKAKAAMKSKAAETPKTPKPAVAKSAKPTPKATPKAAKAPEKQPAKPKKIKELKKEDRPIQAKFAIQKSIRLPDDHATQKCWITGIAVFPSGEIIVVDMANRKIKLFSKDFEHLSQIKLDTIPQDISVSPVNASDAYFTKPFSKEGIQKVTMADGKLTLKESFWTNGTNRGITCTKAGILTSVQDGRYHDLDINHFKIDLLDYEGKVIQSVSTDTNGSRLFKLPLYFTVNSTGKQIIVADCIKHFSYVVSVDMTGKIKFKFEGISNNLVTPRGLTIDDEDNIYVTEWERHNVYILSPAGKRLQVLFTDQELQEEGLDGLQKPYQLCFYKQDDTKKLIVSQEGCDTVKVFTVAKKEDLPEGTKEAEGTAVSDKKVLTNGDTLSEKGKAASAKKEDVTNAAVKKDKTEEKKQPTADKEEEIVSENQESVPSVAELETGNENAAEKGGNGSTAENEKPEESIPTETASNVEGAEQRKQPEEREISPPTLEAEFDQEFETAEVEENSAVQNAIDTLNDSKGEQNDEMPTEVRQSGDQNVVEMIEEPAAVSEAPTEADEQISEPRTETVNTQEQVVELVVSHPEEMEVQHIELINSDYGQEVGVSQVEELGAQQVETEIQSVPSETVVIIQPDMNQMNPEQYEKIETFVENNNQTSNHAQAENVQIVTGMNMGEGYVSDFAQGEIVTEMPEEVVTMGTEIV